ncbi:ABC transporter substrate-binding protein [Spiribacter sp. 221]|uniref:ABC transporter substrate-binding protein n=1 Tax=Spiribacter onubensis TaxID=3122420 RepID=UPI00349F0F88
MLEVKKTTRWALAAMLAAATITGVSTTATAKEQINVGACVSWPGYSFFEIVRQQNLAPDYDIDISIFEDPLGGHAALATGQLDVYLCTGDYTPVAAARGLDVTNVAVQNLVYGVDKVVIGPGLEPEDLRGQRIAAPQAYIGQLVMGLWLDSVGISPDEVTWVNLNADEAVGPMMSGDLGAAYMYEPWVNQVVDNLDGARIIADTSAPELMETGIFMDVMYMNTNFIAEHREAAIDMLKARFEATAYWNEHTEEVNQAFADYLQWSKADIESIMGTNGKYLEGGLYMLDFNEVARICGVMDGAPPFGIENGAMESIVELTNEWWIKLDLMDEMLADPSDAFDCSLVADLAAQGYRQDFSAR